MGGFHFEGTVDGDDALESFDSDIGFRGAVTLELADTAGDLGGTLELASLALPTFEVGPASVTPYMGVTLRLSGHAEAGAKVSMVAPFDVATAFSNGDAEPGAATTMPPRFLPEIGLPDVANALAFDATVEVDLTMTFLVAIEGIPIGGPVLAASGCRARRRPARPAVVDLDGLAGLKYGWSMPDLLGAPQPPERLHTLVRPRRWDIAHARDAAPIADVSTRWSRAFDIFNQDHTGGCCPSATGWW